MNYFTPSRSNGERLRADMDRALWSSVRDLPQMRDAPLDPGSPASFASPVDYGAYFDLAFPLPKQAELTDEIASHAHQHLHGRLNGSDAGARPDSANPRVTTLDAAHYSPHLHEQLIRWMDIEPVNPMGLAAGADDEMDLARSHIERVLDILKQAIPDLYEETVTILDEIVSVKADGGQRFDYDGGSTFALWGLILINADAHPGWPRYCKTIVHEAAHNVLFAIGRKEALVLNDPGQSYGSPLRDDPRPMDGIFHAAFVAARESLAFDRILAWDDRTGALSEQERADIVELFEVSVITFWQCDEVMRSDVSLSPLGVAVLADCKDYMEANFALIAR